MGISTCLFLLKCSHIFRRLIQTVVEDVYIHVKTLQQKHIPGRGGVGSKKASKIIYLHTSHILLFLTWPPKTKLKSLLMFFLVFLYTLKMSICIIWKYLFLKKSHYWNIIKCFLKVIRNDIYLFIQNSQSSIRDQTASLSGF